MDDNKEDAIIMRTEQVSMLVNCVKSSVVNFLGKHPELEENSNSLLCDTLLSLLLEIFVEGRVSQESLKKGLQDFYSRVLTMLAEKNGEKDSVY
jgi:hypothetical protein